MSEPIDIDTLRLSPLLVGLRDDELLAFVRSGHRVEFLPGRVVVSEGSPGDAMYLLVKGGVVVEKTLPGDQPVELTVLDSAGAFFGEMVFVDVMPRSATVRTLKPTTLLAFPLEALHAFFETYGEAHHTILLNIARELSKRLRQADRVIAELKRKEK